MRIFSTFPLSTGSVTWQEQPGQWTLTVVCKATYRLQPIAAQVVQPPEGINDREDHWDDDPRKSVYSPSDLAPRKPRAEVLLVGSAFAPGRMPVRSLLVRVTVGEMDKSIEVFGARTCGMDGVLQDGPRWTQTPLRYERAAGGPETWNPVGVDSEVMDTHGRRALPSLQPPGLLVEPRMTFPPIGYGPLAAGWEVRRRRLGARAATWSDESWMELPLDIDFDGSYFQSAPQDQMVEELRPDEPIILENLHPEHERLVTRLPGLRPVVRVEIEGMAPWELSMTADTLWIDTNRSLCTLTFRGQLPLDGRDQEGTVLVGVEDKPGRPVRWPERPPADTDHEDQEQTQTDGAALERKSGSRAVLPFTPASAAIKPPPMPPEVFQTQVIRGNHKPRGKMPSWLEGAEGERAPLKTPPPPPPFVPPPRASESGGRGPSAMFTPPPPPPPRASESGGRGPSAMFTPPPPPRASESGGQVPSAVFPLPPLPPPPAAPTFGQMAVSLGPPLPLSSAVGSVPADPPPPRPTLVDGRTLAAAAFLGAADASTAAAGAPEPAEAVEDGKSMLHRPAGLLEILWYAPDAADRMRADPVFQEIIARRKAEKSGAAEGEKPPAEDPNKADRTDIAVVLSRGAPVGDVEAALAASADEDGVLEERVVLVFGELELRFDELETLKLLLNAAAPLGATDRKLKEVLDQATEAQETSLGRSPEVAASFCQRVREAWSKANRSWPADHLEVQSRRVLLSQRSYQIREIFDAPWIRALYHAPGGGAPVPAYLPADIAKRLPLFVRFPVRLGALVLPQQDQTEAHPASLRVLVLARLVPTRSR